MHSNAPETRRWPRRRLLRTVTTTGLAGLLTLASSAVAHAAPLAAEINTKGLDDLLRDNVLNIAILVIGLVVLFLSRKQNWAAAVTTVSIVFLGLAVVGMSTGTTGSDVGEALVGLVFTKD